MLKIAITGGLATGKSSLCHFFKDFGAYIVHSDDVVDDLYKKNSDVKQSVIKLLGKDILKENGQIDKKEIAKIVFNDKKKLKNLEKLIHPYVFNEIRHRYNQVQTKSYIFFVVEIPLLFETHQEKFYDAIIFMCADEKLRQIRWQQQKKELADYEKRKSNFINEEKKKTLSDYVIMNNQGLDDLKQQVKNMIKTLNKMR